jgi:hypothetical protein
MADTGVVDLDADFVRLGRRDLNVLDGEVLAGLPGDCGLCSCQPQFSQIVYVVIVIHAPPIFLHPCGLAPGLRLHVAGPHAKAFVGGNMG